jgi:CRP-like cAMP-binding protein
VVSLLASCRRAPWVTVPCKIGQIVAGARSRYGQEIYYRPREAGPETSQNRWRRQRTQEQNTAGYPSQRARLGVLQADLIELKLHDLLQEPGGSIEFSYFPNTAMASILNVMEDGKSVEVGLAGKEGFVGLPLIAGFRTNPNRIVTQAAGTAFSIDAKDLRKILRQCPQLADHLLRYSQEAAMEVTQIAACNRLHEVDERLA